MRIKDEDNDHISRDLWFGAQHGICSKVSWYQIKQLKVEGTNN